MLDENKNIAVELLTNQQMNAADQAAVAVGVPSLDLMENAGRAVADLAEHIAAGNARIAILCGPGNNGGDGFVAARHLVNRGFPVELGLLGTSEQLRGDAAKMAKTWQGRTLAAPDIDLTSADLIVDALFGAGLTRALDGPAADLVDRINAASAPVIAVDVPSGLDGSTGQAGGSVVQATHSITFFRLKPGHLLMPGRALCGTCHLADIGIPERVVGLIGVSTFRNALPLWEQHWRPPELQGHKYTRGHVVVLSGPEHATGAARLAAAGAQRAGAGLVTIASPRDAVAANAANLTSIMIAPLEDAADLAGILSDPRKNAAVIGPGAGVTDVTLTRMLHAIKSDAALVLDADALTVAARDPTAVFRALKDRTAPTVLTPHEGEFSRLFPGMTGDKLERARQAAEVSGATVVLKGPDTVIAAPDGQAAINDNAPPWLATAGAGDVLAGFMAGLLAQSIHAWPASCMAVWLHGACASTRGPGMIAEDLLDATPSVFNALSEDIAQQQRDKPPLPF